ncbi:MAG: bifunctional riboflavin kinase/FAD synthetase [Gammaproteobacteria bacterium]|nr:bifunctional riboflavin kinase/FAD synthetase [Gammaproteobacteria bacterium]
MKLIRGLHGIAPEHRGNVMTIGNFDGVHHGHLRLLDDLVAKGVELERPTLLMTFEPQPREFFRGREVPARLTRFREKMHLLRPTGIDRVLCIPFNEATASMPASYMARDVLRDILGAEYVMVGDDFRFGAGRVGDYAMLKSAGDRYGYGVSHMDTLMLDGERVSSTGIRSALAAGDLVMAEKLLGHKYFMMGHVVYGRQIGRTIGVPTANIRLQRYRSALTGVFCVSVHGLDRRYTGVANIGVRPTVDGREPLLEVHIFDFDEDIYGRLLTVTVHHRLRDERKFPSLEALKAQIEIDIGETKEWFG